MPNKEKPIFFRKSIGKLPFIRKSFKRLQIYTHLIYKSLQWRRYPEEQKTMTTPGPFRHRGKRKENWSVSNCMPWIMSAIKLNLEFFNGKSRHYHKLLHRIYMRQTLKIHINKAKKNHIYESHIWIKLTKIWNSERLFTHLNITEKS